MLAGRAETEVNKPANGKNMAILLQRRHLMRRQVASAEQPSLPEQSTAAAKKDTRDHIKTCDYIFILCLDWDELSGAKAMIEVARFIFGWRRIWERSGSFLAP